MAKANKRGQSGKRTHSVEHEYKIPIRHRREFMGNNISKWVSEKKYKDYLSWKERNKK